MRKLVSTFCLFGFALLLASAQGYSLKQFDLNNGLAGNIVYDIKQDTAGYLWIGTNRGLSRYDGLNFKNYNDPILQNSDIILLEEVQGKLYFLNINRQLFYIQQDRIIPASFNALQGAIYSFINYPIDNSVWYYTDKGLFQYQFSTQKSTFHAGIDNILSTNAHSFCVDQDQNLWILSLQGIFLYHPSKGLKKVISPDDLPKRYEFFRIIYHPSVGVYLTNKKSVYQVTEDYQFKQLLHPNTIPDGEFNFYATTDDWWIYNPKEVYRQHKTSQQLSNFSPNVSNHRINKFYEDHEGNIWLGTDGYGLYMLTNPNILNFNTGNSPLSSNQIQCMTLGEGQTVWLGLSDRSLMRLTGKQLEAVPYHKRKSNTQFYDLIFSRDTLFVVADRVYQIAEQQAGLFYNSPMKSFAIDQERYIWMSGSDLIVRRNRAKSVHEVFMDKLRCYAITPMEKQTWFGTTKGLYYSPKDLPIDYHPLAISPDWTLPTQDAKMDTSYYYTIVGTEPQYKNGIITTEDVFCYKYYDADGDSIAADINHMAHTSDQTLWLATGNIGLYYIKNNQIHAFNETHGLSSNICTDLFVDQDDNVWVATTKGLGKISYPTMTYTHYGSHDGLSADGITSICRAPDSTLYIGTLKGLCVAKESQLATRIVAPRLHLTRLRINEKEKSLAPRYQLSYDQNNIVVDFRAISFKSQLHYLYRLQKEDSWTVTHDHAVRLAELSPGTYQLEIKAQNLNGVQSVYPLQIEFHIAAPWWDTLSFKLALFLLVGGVISLLAYIRIQQVKKQEKEKTNINKRFAELELQALQAQMNPHFVFNALGAIQKFILNQEEEEASDYLSRFAQLMRLFLDSSREKYINLTNELHLLKLYLALEQLRFGDKFSYQIITDPELDLDTIEIPSMLLQPFVENAINHGLLFKATEGLLTIHFQIKTEQLLQCTIEDNGVGRKASARRKRQANNAYKSRGTSIVNDRLKVLNFIEETDIQIETKDRVDAQQRACGTTVNILIPIEQ